MDYCSEGEAATCGGIKQDQVDDFDRVANIKNIYEQRKLKFGWNNVNFFYCQCFPRENIRKGTKEKNNNIQNAIREISKHRENLKLFPSIAFNDREELMIVLMTCPLSENVTNIVIMRQLRLEVSRVPNFLECFLYKSIDTCVCRYEWKHK